MIDVDLGESKERKAASTDAAEALLKNTQPNIAQTATAPVTQPATLKRVIAFVVFVILATALTWALGLIKPGEAEPTQIAFNEGFPGDLEKWERRGDWDTQVFTDEKIFIQRIADKQAFAFRTFDLPERVTENRAGFHLEIDGTIQKSTVPLENTVEPGDNPKAVFMAWFHDSTGEVIQYRTVKDLEPSVESYEANRSFSIPDEATAFSVAIGTRDSAEGYNVTDAKAWLIGASETTQWIQIGLAVLWAFILMTSLYWVIARSTLPVAFLIVGAVVAVFIGILLPESVTLKYITSLRLQFSDNSNNDTNLIMGNVFKVGHFIFFAVISFLLFLKRASLGFGGWMLFILLITLALATEGLQLQLHDRTTRLSDLGIDLLGVMLGCGLAAPFTRRSNKPENELPTATS